MRTCCECGTVKPREEFTKSGYCSQRCASARTKPETRAKRLEQSRAWQQRNGWKRDLLRNHNLTAERYESILESQGGVCAACECLPYGGRRLDVDHDHQCCDSRRSCGKCVRGLLCRECNFHLGKLESGRWLTEYPRPQQWQAIYEYLERVNARGPLVFA